MSHRRFPALVLSRARLLADFRNATKNATVKRVAFVIVALLVLDVMYRDSLRAHFRLSSDPSELNDDARVQIYPFDRYRDPELYKHDYLGRYNVDCMAIGYRLLYATYSHFNDPRVLSKTLPYILLAITVGAVSIAAMRWGKTAGAWMAAALCLSTAVFLDRMGGGLPRAFGFPIIACGAAALVHGRMRLLAFLTCLGASFYAAPAFALGLTLTIVLLFFPASHRGDASGWSLRKRLIVVVATGAIAGGILLPTSLALRKYGRMIRPSDVTEYPEAGPNGRFFPGDRPPFKKWVTDAAEDATNALTGAGEPWSKRLEDEAATPHDATRTRLVIVGALVGIALMGAFVLAQRDSGARRLWALGIVSVAGHAIAAKYDPFFYLPRRYSFFPIPILVILMLTGAASILSAVFGRFDRPWLRATTVAAAGVLCLAYVGGQGSPTAGITWRIDRRSKLYTFLATLPKDAVIAGWPDGAMDDVPYATRRTAFLMREGHVAFHTGYVEELRRRMFALIEAYFASDAAPLLTLRDSFRVDYLLIDLRHFEGNPPRYFAPFTAAIQQAHARGQASGFEARRDIETAAVFKDQKLVVLDLHRLPNPSDITGMTP